MGILKYKPKLNYIFMLVLFIVIAITPALFMYSVVYATTGSMYLSPSSTTVLNGSQFTIEVRANAVAANTAQVDITYPNASLDLMSYSSSGSAMPNLVQTPNTSAGSFSAVMYTTPGGSKLSGDSLLISLVFKAKSGSGSATINLQTTSKLVNAGSLVTSNFGSSVVTLATPAPPPASAPIINEFKASPDSVVTGGTITLGWAVSNSVGCSIVPGGPTNTTATSWVTPKLTTIGIAGSTYTLSCNSADGSTSSRTVSASVSAVPIVTPQVSTPAKVAPKTSATPAPSAKPEVKSAYTPPVALTPITTSAAGVVSSSVLIINDKTGKPMANVEVTFEGASSKVFKADKDGRVVVTNLPAGKLTMSIRSGGKEISKQEVTLVAGVTDTAQQVKLNSVSATGESRARLLYIAAIVGLLLLVVAVVLVLAKRRARKNINQPMKNSASVNLVAPIKPIEIGSASVESAKQIVAEEFKPTQSSNGQKT